MRNILITGFEPFGGERVNPSQCLMESAAGKAHTLLLPTSYRRSMETLALVLSALHPDALLCIGQAGGRSQLSLERVGINWMESAAADNDGVTILGQRIEPKGPDGYLSTLDIPQLLETLRRADVPARVSLSAGSFVCNRVLYGGLHWAALFQPSLRVGFLHVPYLPGQVLDKPQPSMDLSCMIAGLDAILPFL